MAEKQSKPGERKSKPNLMNETSTMPAHLEELKTEITKFKNSLETHEPILLPSAKLRYLLDELEKQGRPLSIDPYLWKFFTTRSKKWDAIRTIKVNDDKERKRYEDEKKKYEDEKEKYEDEKEKYEAEKKIYEDEEEKMGNPPIEPEPSKPPTINGTPLVNEFLDCLTKILKFENFTKMSLDVLWFFIETLYKVCDIKLHSVFFDDVNEDLKESVRSAIGFVDDEKGITVGSGSDTVRVTKQNILSAVECLKQFEKKIFMCFKTKI